MCTLVLLVAACSDPGGAADTVEAVPPGAESPRAAVTELFSALAGDDLERAVDLTVTGQALAVAAAEQAPVEELIAVLDTGGEPVLANFWQAFAAEVEELSGAGPADMEVGDAGEPFEVGGHRFALVEVSVPGEAGHSSFVVREQDGWRVDVVGTFAPGLATNLARAVEDLAGVRDGDRVVAALADERAALDAALEDPALPPAMAQYVRAAVVALGGQ